MSSVRVVLATEILPLVSEARAREEARFVVRTGEIAPVRADATRALLK